jgi:hypothetical protein
MPLESKTIVTRSQPYAENNCQWSINDFWPCILDYLTGYWLQTSMKAGLATFSGKNKSGTLPATS